MISESALALSEHTDGELAPPSMTILDLLLVLQADGQAVGWPDAGGDRHGSGTPEDARLTLYRGSVEFCGSARFWPSTLPQQYADW